MLALPSKHIAPMPIKMLIQLMRVIQRFALMGLLYAQAAQACAEGLWRYYCEWLTRG